MWKITFSGGVFRSSKLHFREAIMDYELTMQAEAEAQEAPVRIYDADDIISMEWEVR